MKLLEKVNLIKNRARKSGNYKHVSKQSGVSFHWLQKFAIGSINNPTVDNISKLEAYFDRLDNDSKTIN